MREFSRFEKKLIKDIVGYRNEEDDFQSNMLMVHFENTFPKLEAVLVTENLDYMEITFEEEVYSRKEFINRLVSFVSVVEYLHEKSYLNLVAVPQEIFSRNSNNNYADKYVSERGPKSFIYSVRSDLVRRFFNCLLQLAFPTTALTQYVNRGFQTYEKRAIKIQLYVAWASFVIALFALMYTTKTTRENARGCTPKINQTPIPN